MTAKVETPNRNEGKNMKAAEQKKLTKATELIDEAFHIIEEVFNDREAHADERSEKWHDSEGGEAYLAITADIDNAKCEAESARDNLEEITGNA